MGRHHPRQTALLLVALAASAGCGRRVDPPPPQPAKVAPAQLPVRPTSSAIEATSPSVDDSQPPKPLAENEKDDKPVQNSRVIIDGLNDVGPSGPASAFSRGVVMVTRSDELSLAKLSQAPSKSKKSVPARSSR
jgi:hypothetical protein